MFEEAGVTVRERLRAGWKQMTGSAPVSDVEAARGTELELARRRTVSLPSILSPFSVGNGMGIPKPTQVNLRKFAETPVVRRAINVIKDRIVAMDWQVRVRRGADAEDVGYVERKLRALRQTLEEPNAADSFRTLLEQVIEDALTGGYARSRWRRRAIRSSRRCCGRWMGRRFGSIRSGMEIPRRRGMRRSQGSGVRGQGSVGIAASICGMTS